MKSGVVDTMNVQLSLVVSILLLIDLYDSMNYYIVIGKIIIFVSIYYCFYITRFIYLFMK